MKEKKKVTAIGFTPQVGYLALVVPNGAIKAPKGVDGTDIILNAEVKEKLEKDYIAECNPMLVAGVGSEVNNKIGDLVGLSTRGNLPYVVVEDITYLLVRFNDILITYDA